MKNCNCEDSLDEEAIVMPTQSTFGAPSPIVQVKNHIYLHDEIDETIARALFSVLHEAAMSIISNAIENNCDITPIVLHINSTGGTVNSGLGIIKCMQDIQEGRIHQLAGVPIKVPVNTIIEGEADSMASLIACVGNKRYASKDALSLLHEVRQTSFGQTQKTDDIATEAENLAKFRDIFYKIYMEHSKLTEEQIKEICKDEKYSTPEDLLKFGLIDEII